MLGQEGYVEIQVKHRQGKSIKAISRERGVSRNTVRRYLRSARVALCKARSAKPTKLDGYRGYLKARVKAAHPAWLPATVLFAEITALGCVRSVSGYLSTLKPTVAPDPVVRFETPPGKQMQVEWGAFKLDGQRVSLFLTTLGWSRFTFGLFVENEQFETLRECHEQAFDAFGGVPLEALYDNMRTVRDCIVQDERIQSACRTLTLNAIAPRYPAIAQEAANADSSYVDFLEHCLKAEQAERRTRSQALLTPFAGFPAIKWCG